jgi:glutamate synthase domain-containing protein 2
MSFGALSPNAIRALNGGAKIGGFAHDTGEGGFSPYHRGMGGDVIWEIGSGYFGCRNADGSFCPETFAATAAADQIKMVELKLSQGAKPGHGGVLPAAKVSREIAETRGVPLGKDCISPSSHSAFSTPIELVRFVGEMRRLSGGKPAGFKLCIGHPWEFLAICKAMLATNVYPDFIVIDGKEGGTGAAPLEFVDHLGMPLRDGLTFAHNALLGIGVRDRIKIGASGKIASAFDIARALVVPDKLQRVANFHASTMQSLVELTAAAGLDHPGEFALDHFSRRVSASEVMTFRQLYPPLEPGELLRGTQDVRFAEAWKMASVTSFRPSPVLDVAMRRQA